MSLMLMSHGTLPPLHRRDKPDDWSPRDFEQAPYLRGLPEMPDEIALLAGQPRLTRAEERLVAGYVRRIRRAVRAARERWEAEFDTTVVDCL